MARNFSICEYLLCLQILEITSYPFPSVQIHLHGVSNCIEWTGVGVINKTKALAEELVKHVQDFCGCNFSVSHIYRPNFECFDTNQDYVTWRAYLISYSDIHTSDLLIGAIEDWISSTSSVSILGDSLQIDQECPVLVTSLSIQDCHNDKMSAPLDPTHVAIIASLCAVIVLLTFVFLACCLAWRKYKRYKQLITTEL